MYQKKFQADGHSGSQLIRTHKAIVAATKRNKKNWRYKGKFNKNFKKIIVQKKNWKTACQTINCQQMA